MKKTLVALILVNACTATTAFAAADAGTWYSGAKFGWSHYFDTNTGSKALESNNSSNHFDIDHEMSAAVSIRVTKLRHGLRLKAVMIIWAICR